MATLKRSTIYRPTPLKAIYIPIYLSNEEISATDRLSPELSIASPGLTDAGELRKLIDLATGLSTERRTQADDEHPAPPIRVIGPGAHLSDKYPYRTPEATDNRAELLKLATLIELPDGIAWDDKKAIRMFLARRSARIESEVESWREKQRQIELRRPVY